MVACKSIHPLSSAPTRLRWRIHRPSLRLRPVGASPRSCSTIRPPGGSSWPGGSPACPGGASPTSTPAASCSWPTGSPRGIPRALTIRFRCRQVLQPGSGRRAKRRCSTTSAAAPQPRGTSRRPCGSGRTSARQPLGCARPADVLDGMEGGGYSKNDAPRRSVPAAGRRLRRRPSRRGERSCGSSARLRCGHRPAGGRLLSEDGHHARFELQGGAARGRGDSRLAQGHARGGARRPAPERPFYVSRDGRYLLRGEAVDLTVDPLKQVMSKIKLDGVPSRGPADAKVTIVEYSDYECPFCSRAYATMEDQVLKDYGDRVRFV